MGEVLEEALREIALARSEGFDSVTMTIWEAETLSETIASLRLSLSEKSEECDRWIARVKLLEARADAARSALSAREPKSKIPPPTVTSYAEELGRIAAGKLLLKFGSGAALPTVRSVAVVCDHEWDSAVDLLVGRYPFTGDSPKLKRAFGRAFYSAINDDGEGKNR